MIRSTTVMALLFIAITLITSPDILAGTGDSAWEPLIEIAFEQNTLEMAVLLLINDNNVPVSDVIQKARENGFGYTRIVDALIDSKLSSEQVIMDALRNNVPPSALLNSETIREDYDYTPEQILRLLVKELMFMEMTEEYLGEKDENRETKKRNTEIIIKFCNALIDDEGFSQFDVMFNLCQAEAGNTLIAETADQLDISLATTLKACPKHAEYGQAYISHDLPQEAYIIIGVDHQTLDDNAGRGPNVISPKRP